MSFVLPSPAVPSVAVAASDDRFPVRRILCVGRNYADHAREMGADPDREPPFFFAKPGDAAVAAAGTVPYPTGTHRLEHEIELVVAIGVGGSSISAASALDHVWGYGVGVDLTRRDLQQEAKDARRPWDVAKGFDASAPVSPLVPARSAFGGGAPDHGRVWLAVDGETRQDGDLRDLIWPVADVVAAASEWWRLAPGDLIFTGTPAGVGPLEPGAVVTGGVDGVGGFSFVVGDAR
ncbi:fumarylacetoacetate hydrolase family protein [Frondihabitans peucedani]|uniref:Fumarylacetoacetate hydrolase family protein n=1 Tax=Frondihabitans peucedani TaxID=598626 RepID=A0ABP8E0J4_9MICO